MAGYTLNFPPTSGGQTVSEFPEGVRVVKWVLTTADPTGTAYMAGHKSDKSVHVLASSTFGGATVAVQGSNESDTATPTNMVTLHDPSHGAGGLSFAASALEQVLENTWWIAPKLTTVGAGATITVELLIETAARR